MLKIVSSEFVKSAYGSKDLLRDGRPQVAFAGRSNVGKSSLINALLNRRQLARTSKTPGRTREINYYLVNGMFYFVDLPGYGYAKVPLAVRDSWRPLVESYIHDNASLRLMFLLVDARRGPGAEENLLAQRLRAEGRPCQVTLTKKDKLSRQAYRALEASVGGTLGGVPIGFSSLTREGREALLERIEEATGGVGPE